ncbi:MAG TPA: cell division protein FtsZ [Cyclobacteriaceae bacterium]|nr:cell division protein FtsZ [Cyclobacteriaceae bacterium]HRJ82909.1 cell division protein FtsZ [Cyclobacteriaceae bacterium]
MIETGSYQFDIPKHQSGAQRSIIKVIGVGGGGSNAVNHMFRQGIKDVEFVVCNTDLQALNSSPVPTKLQIGVDLTEGLGCGANPKVGKGAAIESKEQIREFLEGTKMLFVTAGMGGGTGTGAAPVIAKIAKSMGILTVGIVTAPFMFEGKKKKELAEIGIKALRRSCDTVLVILNDKLREIYGNLAIGKAFAQADNVLTTAAKGIAEIITLTGYVNVDFQDVRTVMYNAGPAVMGTAETRGENRARNAASGALASPLLDNCDIMGAKKILLSIISGEEAELQMDELMEITEYIQQQSGQDAEVIFGHGVDAALGDRLRVTVIATGFDHEEEHEEEDHVEVTQKKPTVVETKKVHDLERNQIWLFEQDQPIGVPREVELKQKGEQREEQHEEERPLQHEVVFKGPFNRIDDDHSEDSIDDDGEEGLFGLHDDEFDHEPEKYSDQVINDEGMMELRNTRKRLEDQARERKEKLKNARKQEMTKEEFNEKWALPAYLRRGIKMDNVPHSSESFISKFNLNDDNNILGNNKFLHDNVD